MGFQFQFVGSTSPFLVEDLGIDYASVGFLIGLYLLPGVVLALPGGFIGQRFGDKQVVVTSLVLMFIGGVLIGSSDSNRMVSVGRFISGVGAVLLNVMLTKMTTDWFAEREIVLAMAILINAWPIGIGIALITLGPLGEALSWSVAFYATAAAAVVGHPRHGNPRWCTGRCDRCASSRNSKTREPWTGSGVVHYLVLRRDGSAAGHCRLVPGHLWRCWCATLLRRFRHGGGSALP